MKGIPNRIYEEGWNLGSDTVYPPTDYFLSLMLYMDSENMFEEYPSLPRSNYYGLSPPEAGFQARDSIAGYIRDVNVTLDRNVAYGRVEAIDKERTFELIDRTILAENNGLSGNFFYQSQNTIYDNNVEFFRRLTSVEDKCIDYIINFLKDGSVCSYANCDDFPEDCRFGFTAGEIPGKKGSIIPRVINASVYIGNWHGHWGCGGIFSHWQDGFGGFYNMLNWRITEDYCKPLCENTVNPELCRENSRDYFKEINTDCVGVGEGFIGWQYRSYPVGYYHFFPTGWGSMHGVAHPAYANSPSFIMDGDSYKDEIFTDDKFLRYGLKDNNLKCENSFGGLEDCKERIGVNFRNGYFPITNQDLTEPRKVTLRFRRRNDDNPNARIYGYITAQYREDGVNEYATTINSVAISEKAEEWKLEEFNITVNNRTKPLVGILLFVYSDYALSSDTSPYGYIDLDGFELIDTVTGENYLNHEWGSFNYSNNYRTSWGDWAPNVIDRLGGIAWWGSATHLRSGGHAYAQPQKMMGAFFSGKTLGESIFFNSERGGTSGLFYGDPLYRPSGVKIIINDGINNVGVSGTGHSFYENDESNLSINAFHGNNNFKKTNWKLDICYNNSLDLCLEWEEIDSGDYAVYEKFIFQGLDRFVLDKNEGINFIMRLKVWNPGEEEKSLTNYGFFHYKLGSAQMGVASYEHIPELNDSDLYFDMPEFGNFEDHLPILEEREFEPDSENPFLRFFQRVLGAFGLIEYLSIGEVTQTQTTTMTGKTVDEKDSSSRVSLFVWFDRLTGRV